MALVCTVFSIAARADDKQYEIKMDRPGEVGREIFITETGTVAITVSYKDATGKVVTGPQQKYSAELAATEKALAIEAVSHSATKVQLTVKKFLKDNDPLVPEGAVVVIEDRGDGAKVTVDGDEADADLAGVLGMFVNVSSPKNHISEADVFQPDKPQKIGGSWHPAAKALSEYYTSLNYHVDPADVSATVTLEDVTSGPRGPVLHLVSTLEMTNLRSDWKDNQSVKNGKMKVESTGAMAADPKDVHGEGHRHMTFDADMNGKSPDGKVFEYHLTMERSMDGKSGPVDGK